MSAYRDDNGTEKCVATYQYDVFGNLIWKYYKSVIIEGEYAPRLTFSTKEYLSDAELYLYAYRVYDPIAGRWMQRDPIDYQDSVNLYQFCGNNPVNGIDAFGLWTWTSNHTKTLFTGLGHLGAGIGLAIAGVATVEAGVGVVGIIGGYTLGAFGIGEVAATIGAANDDRDIQPYNLTPGDHLADTIKNKTPKTPGSDFLADAAGTATDAILLPGSGVPKVLKELTDACSLTGKVIDDTQRTKKKLDKKSLNKSNGK